MLNLGYYISDCLKGGIMNMNNNPYDDDDDTGFDDSDGTWFDDGSDPFMVVCDDDD